MDHNFDNLTEEQKERVLEFGQVSACCSEDVLEAIELSGNMKRLYQYIPRVLSGREREIIMLRYGLYNHRPVTQREIADKIGISRSYVSRIEKRALEKLKREFEK